MSGFKGTYDFFYLPMDFKSMACFGYAFINFLLPEDARRFIQHFNGFSEWTVPSRKVCDVVWCSTHQGLTAHVERYRNSPVMHDSMPDECKPCVFKNGQQIAYPEPTRKIRAPRSRPHQAGTDQIVANDVNTEERPSTAQASASWQ